MPPIRVNLARGCNTRIGDHRTWQKNISKNQVETAGWERGPPDGRLRLIEPRGLEPGKAREAGNHLKGQAREVSG